MSIQHKQLYPQPLTKAAFAAFGDVIETADSDWFPINAGTTQRYHALATVDVVEAADADSGPGSNAEARVILSIFRASRRQFPLVIDFVEKHPLGSQAFVPMAQQPFLVLVAPPGATPTLDSLRLFYSDGRQGVNYHRDVWHFPLLALEDDSDFLVADRGGSGHNCDLFHFPEDWQVEIAGDWAKEIPPFLKGG